MANYFKNAYGATDMSLDTMTEGISKEGIQNLVEVIKAELLTGVSEKLKSTESVETAIKAGWQGQARDVFLDKMSAGIAAVISDLKSEYTDLLKRLAELVDSYYDQDAKMMDML